MTAQPRHAAPAHSPTDLTHLRPVRAIPNFENFYRGWGQNGTPSPALFPSANLRGYADTSDTSARIYDWSLDSEDTAILDALSVPGESDTLTHSWSGSTTEFLRNAVEILGDRVGNDNGLCEAGEDCIYTPNIGSYQGHGELIFLTTVGTIDLYEYDDNGR